MLPTNIGSFGQTFLKEMNKHGHPRQFFFLFGRFLKFYSSATTWTNKAKVDILHSHFTTQYSPEVFQKSTHGRGISLVSS
jgi:hypothetical protein